MTEKPSCCRHRVFILGLALTLAGGSGYGASVPEGRASLADSVKEVEATGGGGRGPAVIRTDLRPAERGASMEVEVSLRLRNFAELQARIDRHEIIPRQEMARTYLPLAADADRIAVWLSAQGLAVTRNDATHLGVFARGTVDQVSVAFQVRFARVLSEGEEFTSAVTAPSLPAVLAPSVIGVEGLQPHVRLHPSFRRLSALASSTSSVGAPYTPAQLVQAYNVPGLTGAGQTIAIIDDQYPAAADLNQFWQLYGISENASAVSHVTIGNGPSASSDPTESALDVEWATAMAPAAKIRVYGISSLTPLTVAEACLQIYTDLPSQPGLCQLSLSFGSAENTLSSSNELTESQGFAVLASQGVTVYASSGDGGSNPSFSASSGWSNLYPGGTIQSCYPASDANVTGVGGTSLNLAADGTVASETAWDDSGGGASVFVSRPAWQTGAGIGSGAQRLTPDVAALGDGVTGVNVVIGGTAELYGGTSLGSPLWAAFGALINQARASAGLPSLGPLNSRIYPLLGTPCFWDITGGNNGAESAGGAYDETTGLGVPNVANLVASLGGGTPAPAGAPLFVQRPANVTVAPGGSATLPAVVSGAAPLVYQWQRMPAGSSAWANLGDNGTYGGSAGASLQINSATSAMSGDRFRCVCSNSQGQAIGPVTALATAYPLTVSTFAGTVGVIGSADGTGKKAEFDQPNGIVLDLLGNLYLADIQNDIVRKITPAGVVTTLAGQAGVAGSADGLGPAAQFNQPDGMAIDSNGNLYVADFGNNTIRMVAPGGAVTTLAGSPGQAGSADGTGSAALFSSPRAVEVDAAGNLYVSDGNNTIRKIAPGGVVTTLAGTAGVTGFADGQGASAQFNGPRGLRLDAAGNLWVADRDNCILREITPSGVVTTVAGLGGAAGDEDGSGSAARFVAPYGLVFDPSGNLLVTDEGGDTVRLVTPAGIVSTLAGLAANAGSANGAGEAARFSSPLGIAIDSANNLYVADSDYDIVRKAPLLTAPEILAGPQSQSAPAGGYVVLSIAGEGGGIAYQWQFNGAPIAGATGPTYTIPDAAAGNAGAYSVTLTNSAGAAASAPATIALAAASAAPSRLSNLSTRAFVGTGSNIIVAGFVVGGAGAKQVLVRGIGPTLAQFGVSGALADPQLQLFNASGVNVAENTGWSGTAALTAAFAQVFAFPLPPGSADSALLQSVPQGASSAQVVGAGSTTGIALAEVYDFDSGTAPARLVNLSTRAFAASGADALVAGFVISGATSETVLVRGIGPALAQFGFSGVLATPTLTLYDAKGDAIARNTGWGGTAVLTSVFGQAYAFSLPANSTDCALVATLPPGTYTAQVSGVNGSSGTALVEVYEVP